MSRKSSNFLYILHDDALDGDGVKRPKLAAVLSNESAGSSDNLRCCGLDVLKSLKLNPKLTGAESMEYEFGICTDSVSRGGVISTFTSTCSPANDDDWLDECVALMHGVFVLCFDRIQCWINVSSKPWDSLWESKGKIGIMKKKNNQRKNAFDMVFYWKFQN